MVDSAIDHLEAGLLDSSQLGLVGWLVVVRQWNWFALHAQYTPRVTNVRDIELAVSFEQRDHCGAASRGRHHVRYPVSANRPILQLVLAANRVQPFIGLLLQQTLIKLHETFLKHLNCVKIASTWLLVSPNWNNLP